MKRWGNRSVVETIYEEECEYSSSSSSDSLSPSLASPPTTLRSRVDAWSLAKRCKPDLLIHVQGTCFHLHKDPLTSRSAYLKRQITDLSELNLSPQLNITAQTFSSIADFCYGTHIVITPFNVAALRTAAELLEMTHTDGDEDLKQITEADFRRFVTVNQEYALIVLRSCLSLLPEAAFLVSRCIEALSLTDEGYGIVNLLDDVVTLGIEDFKIVAESISLQFTSHDVLYEIVDLHLKDHYGDITEEQKTQICNSVDCNRLSSPLLLHAVQNPRMPLRFIIRAMLAEQLNTRRSIFSASNNHPSLKHHHQTSRDPITLGAILERDAALRESAQLKAAMEATTARIHNLENELNGMKYLLSETEKERNELNEMNKLLLEPALNERSVLVSGRSASFHCGKENKVERGERGSVSSSNIRCSVSREEGAAQGFPFSEGSRNDQTPRKRKNIAQRLITGLKTAFRVSKQSSDKEISSCREDGNKVGYEDEYEYIGRLPSEFIKEKVAV